MKFSRPLYEKIEEQHGRYTRISFRAVNWVVFGMYLVPLRQPLSYMLFGQPDPGEWTLPHGYR